MIKNLIGIILFLSIATTAISETIAPSPAELKTAIKLAEQGNAEAQFNLGLMYYFGQEVRQDYAKAAEWFEKAAAQDVADAQFNLGFMYYNGKGVRQVNHPGNRGGCLVKVKQVPQPVLQVVDSNALRLRPAGYPRSIPADAGG
ncbi:MAG TPA: tetratricopeptide repeat protein [Paenalcaligenes sp.]|nr:tetratricopeptide repeat protein [Paenalcaligenes sp.]